MVFQNNIHIHTFISLPLEIEQAARALNANVPCPGISPAADASVVQAALRAVLRALMRLLSRQELDVDLTARGLCTLLQCLFRIVPCVAGYRGFVEVQEVDTRLLIVQLLLFGHAFVNYWTLELLTALCRCPRTPRTMQQVLFFLFFFRYFVCMHAHICMNRRY